MLRYPVPQTARAPLRVNNALAMLSGRACHADRDIRTTPEANLDDEEGDPRRVDLGGRRRHRSRVAPTTSGSAWSASGHLSLRTGCIRIASAGPNGPQRHDLHNTTRLTLLAPPDQVRYVCACRPTAGPSKCLRRAEGVVSEGGA